MVFVGPFASTCASYSRNGLLEALNVSSTQETSLAVGMKMGTVEKGRMKMQNRP